jgi:2-polyprenyl-3-methyl-5-hydroxy-6-metoxy-1,4-benzoquinol methylase
MTSDNSISPVSTGHQHEKMSVRWLDQDIGSVLAAVQSDRLQTFKEWTRHGMYRLNLFRYLDIVRRLRGIRVRTGLGDSVEARFQEIYDRGLWSAEEGQESLSGSGSSRAATKGLITALTSGMSVLGCETLLDVGCGDWNWMQHETLPIDYLGIDVVESVIARNQQQFASPRVRFEVCNAISEPLPVVDMVLCREVLFHLSFADARRMLLNIAKSANYLCATTDIDIRFNSDIPTGDFRPFNLLRPPFRLPQPQALIPDNAVRAGRFLGVWDSAALSAALK